MQNRLRRSTQSFSSNRYSDTGTSLSQHNYGDELGLSEIPRAVDDSRGSTFFSLNMVRRSTLFEPAQSQLEYQDAYSPIVMPRNPERRFPTAHQEEVWRYFTSGSQNDASLYDDGITEYQFDKTSKKLVSNVNSQNSIQTDHQHNHADLDNLILEQKQEQIGSQNTVANESLITKSKLQELATAQKMKLSLSIDHNVYSYEIEPSSTASIPLENDRIPTQIRQNFKKRQQKLNTRRTNLPKIVQQQSNFKLDFLELAQPQEENRQYPLRRTRMPPLKYWLGESIAYKEHKAKGYFKAIKK